MATCSLLPNASLASWLTHAARRGARATYTVHDSIAELGRLADTAGLKVRGSCEGLEP